MHKQQRRQKNLSTGSIFFLDRQNAISAELARVDQILAEKSLALRIN
jgi:hypothetical protein